MGLKHYWTVDGVDYESSTEAAKATGISGTRLRSYCQGYTTKGGKEVPPRPGFSHRTEEMKPKEVRFRRVAPHDCESKKLYASYLFPIPMPTLNRLFAMQHWERKKCRDLIKWYAHVIINGGKIVSKGGDSAKRTEYMQCIRPSAKNKTAFKQRGIDTIKWPRWIVEIPKPEEGQMYLIDYIHYRHKKADRNNLIDKAFTDSLVNEGVLLDDAEDYLEDVTHKQVIIPKTKEEMTEVFIFKYTRAKGRKKGWQTIVQTGTIEQDLQKAG